MKARVIGVSLADHNGDFFPDGSECFTIQVNLKRGPEWEKFFTSFKDRKPVEIRFDK